MPTVIEQRVMRGTRPTWKQIDTLRPGPPGTMSHNPPDGPREVFMFGPNDDDTETVIFRVDPDTTLETNANPFTRILGVAIDRLEEVARLRRGESFEMAIRPDTAKGRHPYRVRFRHE